MRTAITNLSKAAFKHIESELYYYQDTLKEITRLQREIMFDKGPVDESGIRSLEVGRPTERIATRLLSHKRLRNLEEMVAAIEYAFNALSEDHQKVIRTKYWSKKRLNWDDVSVQCSMHRNTAMKLRKDVVYLIAEKIGWI
jgi:RinA family phage transcriptional activator